MQFRFKTEELLYAGNMLRSLASSDTLNRQNRRNVHRLAGKFVPWAATVHLKQADLGLISYMLNTGLSFLNQQETALNDEKPEKYEEILPRLVETRDTIVNILVKLNNRE